MTARAGFILKIFLSSSILAVFIKQAEGILKIAPTNTNALIPIVILPAMVGLALWWRFKLKSNQ